MTLLDQMLKKYKLDNKNDKSNAVKEIMQEIVLCGLSKAGFFDKAVFYGGTALRIFYGLDRFSEDLDFSLKTTDLNFDLEKYFPSLENEIKAMGLNLKVEKKIKTSESAIKSAFLKGNTIEHLLMFYSDSELIKGVNKNELIKIKFEVDSNPPSFAGFENKYKLLPSPYQTTLYDLPSLFAGKIHAILCHAWKSRIKGRDLYDFIFFLQLGAKINFNHLKQRLLQTGFINPSENFTMEDLKQKLKERFDTIEFEEAKEDVKPFIKTPSTLDVWSAEFFNSLLEQLEEI